MLAPNSVASYVRAVTKLMLILLREMDADQDVAPIGLPIQRSVQANALAEALRAGARPGIEATKASVCILCDLIVEVLLNMQLIGLQSKYTDPAGMLLLMAGIMAGSIAFLAFPVFQLHKTLN